MMYGRSGGWFLGVSELSRFVADGIVSRCDQAKIWKQNKI